MALTLTAKEQQLLQVVLSKIDKIPEVSWEEIAPHVGHKYARNARSAFTKVWEKLKTPGDERGSTEIAVKKTPVKRKVKDELDGTPKTKSPRVSRGSNTKPKQEDDGEDEEDDKEEIKSEAKPDAWDFSDDEDDEFTDAVQKV